MKKLLSLLLALMCLMATLPAMAEEVPAEASAEEAPVEEAAVEIPELALPISVEDFQAAYAAILKVNAPDCTVSWMSHDQEGQIIWSATINDSFVSLMLLTDGGYVTEIASLIQSELTENALMTFLSMGGYGMASLLHHSGLDEVSTSTTAMSEIFAIFTAITTSETPEDFCGLPAGMSISMLDETYYQFYFAIRTSDAAAEEPAAE